MDCECNELRLQGIRNWLKDRHVGQAFQPAINFPELKPLSKDDIEAVVLYRRRLPHWELPGSTYFMTFRVHRALGKILEKNAIATMVEEALWFGFGERYLLQAYVIMHDHIHVLLKPLLGWSLAKIMGGLKGFTARKMNERLGRKGALWQDESFDHLIRNDRDWMDKFNYIHDNPVKAGLVRRAQDYPFSSLVTMHSRGRLESLPHTDGEKLFF